MCEIKIDGEYCPNTNFKISVRYLGDKTYEVETDGFIDGKTTQQVTVPSKYHNVTINVPCSMMARVA